MGSWPGHSRSAMPGVMIATGALPARSLAVNPRPRRIGWRSTPKYSGGTTLNPASDRLPQHTKTLGRDESDPAQRQPVVVHGIAGATHGRGLITPAEWQMSR